MKATEKLDLPISTSKWHKSAREEVSSSYSMAEVELHTNYCFQRVVQQEPVINRDLDMSSLRKQALHAGKYLAPF